jgi:hypothetical protein
MRNHFVCTYPSDQISGVVRRSASELGGATQATTNVLPIARLLGPRIFGHGSMPVEHGPLQSSRYPTFLMDQVVRF